MSALQDQLAALLLCRLELTHADDRAFAKAPRLPVRAPTTRLIFVAEGTLQYELGGRALLLEKNAALLVPAWSVRRWALPPRASCRLCWCEFIVHPPRPGGLPIVRGAISGDVDLAAMRRLVAALRVRQSLLAEGELKALLARFFCASHSRMQAAVARSSPAESAMERALEWLHQNYAHPVSMNDLAGRSGLSPRQFRELFFHRLGQSPRQYVTSLRMHHARLALVADEQSIKQIALSVGYHDPLYFSRHYRRFWGKSPLQDRAK